MENIDYPYFNTGLGEQSDKPVREWTSEQAERYFDWILKNIDSRVCSLLDYFDESLSGGPENVLDRLGRKAAESLSDPAFASVQGETLKLTDRGFALGADMGLLLAKFLLEAGAPTVYWAIVRKPKTDADYNKPVLTGLSPIHPVDPIGLSLICAWHLKTKGPDGWKKTFLALKAKIGSGHPKNCAPPKWYKP